MSDPIFIDFDAAAAEQSGGERKEVPASFVYGGQTFDLDLNIHAGRMLLWMRGGQSLETAPELLAMFLGEDKFAEFCKLDVDVEEIVLVLKWFAEQLGEVMNRGGSGN